MSRILCALAMLAVCLIANQESHAGPFFVDDFSDGNAADGMPVSWLPGAYPGGTRNASSGDYVHSNPTGNIMSTYVEGISLEDVSIRTQLRISDADFTYAGVFARSAGMFSSYFGNIRPDGTLEIGYTDDSGDIFFLGSQTSSLDVVNDDIHLQFDVFRNSLSLTAWADGETMPITPQVTVNDDRYADGTIGVYFQPNGEQTATFRSFAAVPEPTTLWLAILGLFGLLSQRVNSSRTLKLILLSACARHKSHRIRPRVLWRTFVLAVGCCLPAVVPAYVGAQTLFEEPVRVGVSSGPADWTPVLSADGLELFFTSWNNGDWDLWSARRDTTCDEWGPAESLGDVVNSTGLEDSPTLSVDGLTMIFGSDRGGGEGNWDLWETTRATVDSPWEPPVNLGPPINTRFEEATPSLSPDGLTLLFGPSVVGNRRPPARSGDIWMSQRESIDAPWDEPVNLTDSVGPAVNSPRRSETYPSLSADGLSLYFMSTRDGGLGREDIWVATRATTDEQFGDPVNLGSVINTDLTDFAPFIAADGSLYYTRGVVRGEGFPVWELWRAAPAESPVRFRAGDADLDFDFDQVDLVQVQIAAKYLTGLTATWGEGDWDAAGECSFDTRPHGNGVFDQIDIIVALGEGVYLTGPYGVVAAHPGGDGKATLVYDPASGELALEVGETELTSINIDSAASIFTGEAAENLGGSFDNDADDNIFKATFGSSFGSLSFGNVAQPGLASDFLLEDLTVIGSLAGGGDLGAVDLIAVTEPSSALLLLLGLIAVKASCIFRSNRQAMGSVRFATPVDSASGFFVTGFVQEFTFAPEPSSYLLGLLGFSGIVLARRRVNFRTRTGP